MRIMLRAKAAARLSCPTRTFPETAANLERSDGERPVGEREGGGERRERTTPARPAWVSQPSWA